MKRTQYNKKTTEKDYVPALRRRMFVPVVFLVIVLVVVIARLYFVQVQSHDDYADLATRQHSSSTILTAERGNIYLKSQQGLFPAAINRQYYLAFVSPRDVPEDQIEVVGQKLTDELALSRDLVRTKLLKRNDIYEVLKHRVEAEEKDRLIALDIPGLAFLPEKFRYYPGDELASQVLGFVGSDGVDLKGRYGIEAYYEETLNGNDGRLEQKTDARGGWLALAERSLTPESDGADYVLTIDHGIQERIEEILVEDIETYGAVKASAIVMEAKTGRVRAIANLPTYSSNTFGSVENISTFRNSAVSDEYESGSVFKTFTLAMGLDAGKITPATTYLDRGFIKTQDFTLGNAEDKVYGLQTMTQVLEESINTGVIHVERLLGNTLFKEYVERFGFGAPTGIGLPAEARGNLVNLSNTRREVEFYTASFGQGINVTPIQLTSAYAALANGGTLMKPRIVEKIIHTDGFEEEILPEEVHRVISQEASDDITKMLEQVVVGGHAKLADVSGYRVGGKTGTAQMIDFENGGYLGDDFKTTTFIGYAPLDDPEYVILVKYENPTKAEWAATSAAPTFGRMMQHVLLYYGIRPTEAIEKKKKAPTTTTITD